VPDLGGQGLAGPRRFPTGRRIRFLLAASIVAAAVVQETAARSERQISLGEIRLTPPAAWAVKRDPTTCGISRYGPSIAMSNLSLTTLERPTKGLRAGSCTTGWDLSTLSTGFVLVDVTMHPEGRFGVRNPPATLPIRPRTLATGTETCTCTYRYHTYRLGSMLYDIRVWTERQAPPEARAAVAPLLASITLSR
jgi:hypothetical protein